MQRVELFGRDLTLDSLGDVAGIYADPSSSLLNTVSAHFSRISNADDTCINVPYIDGRVSYPSQHTPPTRING